MIERQKAPLWSYRTGAEINDVAISSDGSLIVAGSGDKKIYSLDQDGRLLWSYEAEETITSVAISSDAEWIGAGSNNGKIFIFNREGRLIWQHPTGTSIRNIAISKDEFIYVFYGGIVQKFNLQSGFTSNKYVFNSEIQHVAITENGESIAISTSDNNIHVLSQFLALFWSYQMGDLVGGLAVSHNGKCIAAGSCDNRIYLFDEKGSIQWKYPTGGWGLNVAITSDCSCIAAGSSDNSVYIINREGKLLKNFACQDLPKAVIQSQDGEIIGIGSCDNNIYCLNRYDESQWYSPVNDWPLRIAMSLDGDSLVSGLRDGRILFFDHVKMKIPSDQEKQNAPLSRKPIKNFDRINPLVQRLFESQPSPLEHLPEFFEYLELNGFEITDEIKKHIEKTISEKIEREKKIKRLKELETQLFNKPSVTSPQQSGSILSVIPQSIVQSGSTCQVCLGEFSSAEPGAVNCPHCNSVFHYRCITKWVNKNHTCPVCKKELKV
jgi:WD40 repeat protein